MELPPHTAPLGMEVGPAQACAVKVVVHDLIRKEERFVTFILVGMGGCPPLIRELKSTLPPLLEGIGLGPGAVAEGN